MSLKGIVFGDLQAHPWQEQISATRWRDCVKVISDVYDKADEVDADFVCFLGDLFESKRAIRSDVMAAVYEKFIENARHFDGHTYLVKGNHDIYRQGCTLQPFRGAGGKITVCETVTAVKLHGYDLLFVPWGSEAQSVGLSKYSLAFTHCEFKGARHSATHVTEDDSMPPQFRNARIDNPNRVIFNGHYHHPKTYMGQKNEDVPLVNVGSPMHHDWSDIDSGPRGCVEVFIDGGAPSWKWHHFDYPRFFRDESSAEFREGKDFALPKLDEGRTAQTATHKDVEDIAGEDTHAMLQAYMQREGVPAMHKRQFLQTGFDLLGGTSYGDDEAMVVRPVQDADVCVGGSGSNITDEEDEGRDSGSHSARMAVGEDPTG